LDTNVPRRANPMGAESRTAGNGPVRLEPPGGCGIVPVRGRLAAAVRAGSASQ
jgi:hypothetical protein